MQHFSISKTFSYVASGSAGSKRKVHMRDPLECTYVSEVGIPIQSRVPVEYADSSGVFRWPALLGGQQVCMHGRMCAPVNFGQANTNCNMMSDNVWFSSFFLSP